jgi:Ni2+-binding GTPase involved in maturation of urease and hydrogenase
MGSISTPATVAPNVNVVGASRTNAIAETIAQQGQQPIKAYVVANDVTTQQGLNRSIVTSASIG